MGRVIFLPIYTLGLITATALIMRKRNDQRVMDERRVLAQLRRRLHEACPDD